jgi:hypothetical protein
LGYTGETSHSRIKPRVKDSQSVVLLRGVEGIALL